MHRQQITQTETESTNGVVVLTALECPDCGVDREHRASYPNDVFSGWTEEDILLDAYAEALDLLKDVPCECYRPSWVDAE